MPLDIDRVHLTTILCNLLDNALEACSKLPANKRNMYLTLTFDSNLLSITVKNAYDPKNIDLQNGIAYTTKADKARVKKTVEKFNGTFKYYTEDSDEESCFIAEAMLYL